MINYKHKTNLCPDPELCQDEWYLSDADECFNSAKRKSPFKVITKKADFCTLIVYDGFFTLYNSKKPLQKYINFVTYRFLVYFKYPILKSQQKLRDELVSQCLESAIQMTNLLAELRVTHFYENDN